MTDINKISILGKESIHIGYGIQEHIANEICTHLVSSNYAIITDTNIDQFNYSKHLVNSFNSALLKRGVNANVLKYSIQPGEVSKTRDTKAQIEDFLLENHCTRDTVILAVGGGVIGDMVGFVAATFMRGVRFVQIPTTLLAMVDSSIGGKTGVDTPAGKNLIGAFWQPERVFIDMRFLESLPEREFINGMAEVIKTAAIWDQTAFAELELYNEKFFNILAERNPDTRCIDLGPHQEMIYKIVSGSVRVKAEVVTLDEREGGLRNLLNFGHSIGHAYEAIFMPNILHGECVSIGMVLEAELSRYLGVLSPASVARLVSCLSSYKLPITPKDGIVLKRTHNKTYTVDELVTIMGVDKKNDGAKKKIVLLSEIGKTYEKKATVVADSDIRFVLSDDVSVGPWSAPTSPLSIEIIPPGSKSISNRALILAALGGGVCRIKNLLHSDDTGFMIRALETLGGSRIVLDGEDVIIRGSSGKLSCAGNESLYLGNAGTAARFITSVSAIVKARSGSSSHSTLVLTGNARMQERPIGGLVDALVSNGVPIKYSRNEGSLPLEIECTGDTEDVQLRGGRMELSASISSQYVSSILMCAPYAREPVTLVLKGKPISELYIDMTIDMMKQFGICVEKRPNYTYFIPQGAYKNPTEFMVESDASSATYPLALAAIGGPNMTVTVPTIGSSSLQGDARFPVEVLKPMGCKVIQTETSTTVTGCSHLEAINVDMETMTDAFLTAAVMAGLAQGTTEIIGIANQRVKECNRIAAMVTELKKFGIVSSELPDGIRIQGGDRTKLIDNVSVSTYDDHRVAMCFSLLALLNGSIIEDRRCTSKTWPGWWDVLRQKFQVACTGSQTNADSTADTGSTTRPTREDRNSIFVIGMRGAGKTAVSQIIADVMGFELLDLDHYLEQTAKVAIPAIIENEGWEGFRKRELNLFEEVMRLNGKNHVIACGGGLVETPKARDLLKTYAMRPGCIVLHVHRDIDDIVAYLQEDKSRPAYTKDIKAVWIKREGWYNECSNKLFISPKLELSTTNLNRIKLQHDIEHFMRLILSESSLEVPTHRSYFVSLTLPTYHDVGARPLLEMCDGCEAVELRVDHLNSFNLLDVAGQIAALRHHLRFRPIIFTIRTEEQCGRFKASNYELALQLMQLALKMEVEYLDVEITWPNKMIETLVSSKGHTKLIASQHSKIAVPWMDSFWQKSYDSAARFGDVVKLVNMAETLEDNLALEVFRRTHHNKPLIALNMGAAGKLSRVLNPILTPVTHGLMTTPAAAGQLSIVQINNMLADLGALTSKEFFICGEPVSQSPSPDLHNAGFLTLGLPFKYARFENSDATVVENHIKQLADKFGGCSVTIPLKEKVLHFLDGHLSIDAKKIGAVNTILRNHCGELVGYNTDWQGIVGALRTKGVHELYTRKQSSKACALIVGAGGTARAAIFAFHQLGFKTIYIVNRTTEKADALAREYADLGVERLPDQGAEKIHFAAAVSCIPANSPLDEALQAQLKSAFSTNGCDQPIRATLLDVAYKPEVTAVMELARQYNWETVPGKEMLFYQGVEQFKLWTKLGAPLSMRDALL